MPQSTFKRTLDETLTDLELFLNKFDVWNKEKLMLAVSLAMLAHQGQVRKSDPDSDVPAQEYIIHPIRVMLILGEELAVKDISLLAAAVLHDVIEDGGDKVTLDDIKRSFGKRVRKLVNYVTKPKGTMTGEQHADYYLGILNVYEARLVKVADRIDNLRDALTLSDKTFQLQQLTETRKYFPRIAAGTNSYMQAELTSLLDQLEARVR